MTTTLAPQQMELALMSREEAEAAVASIHGAARNVRALLRDLERRRGWQSMGFRSFDAFLEAEFDWSPGYAHRQIRAAEVEENLTLPIGSLREAQARELSALPAAVQRMVWERVGGEGGLTAKRIKSVVAEVQVGEATLPGANGDEPAPTGTMTASCRECGRTFSQELAGDAVASRVCPRCRKKTAPPEVTFQPTRVPDAYSAPRDGAPPGPTPPPEGDGGQEATSPHAEDDQGARRLEPTPPREGDLAAPPETTGVISGAETVWVREGTQEGGFVAPGTPPGAGLGHGATDAVSRQAAEFEAPPSSCTACGSPRRWETLPGGGVDARCDACGRVGSHDDRKQAMPPDAPAPRQAVRPPYVDPDDLPPTPSDSSDLAWLSAHGIPEDTALRLARRVVELAGDGNPFRVVEEDAEVLRVVREVSAKVDGGLPRLLRVLSQPGFLNWMNRHGRKRDA